MADRMNGQDTGRMTYDSSDRMNGQDTGRKNDSSDRMNGQGKSVARDGRSEVSTRADDARWGQPDRAIKWIVLQDK